MSAALSLVAFFALCAGLAAAWVPGGCIPALDALQTCAGSLTGAALGAACCPQLQSVYQNCGGQGMETILGESDDMSYWQTLINAMEAEGCFEAVGWEWTCPGSIQGAVSGLLAATHTYALLNISFYPTPGSASDSSFPASAELTFGDYPPIFLPHEVWYLPWTLWAVSSANIPGVVAFGDPLSKVSTTSGLANILLALDVLSLVNGTVLIPTINVTDDSYDSYRDRPADVTYEGIMTPTPGNQIDPKSSLCDGFVSRFTSCPGYKIDFSNFTDALIAQGGLAYLPILKAYYGSCTGQGWYAHMCTDGVRAVADCFRTASNAGHSFTDECCGTAELARRYCYAQNLTALVQSNNWGLSSEEDAQAVLELLESDPCAPATPAPGCTSQIPGAKGMKLPNGEVIAVTPNCTTVDPNYPNCVPAAKWKSKTWYYYYPQYATVAGSEEQLVASTECGA